MARRAGILCRELRNWFWAEFSPLNERAIYTIRLLPIGGFVKMAGEDPEVVKLNQVIQWGSYSMSK
ncbi:hypothetical protein ACEQPO_13300 [Bacillus sp. SL00103]